MTADTVRISHRDRRMPSRRLVAQASLVAAAALALHGCYPYPVYYPPPDAPHAVQPTFDNAWNAARAAAYDEGVRITHEDRASGIARGTKGPFEVTISVSTLADGSLKVTYTTTGPTAQDPTLKDRLTDGYRRRMGR